MYLSSWCFYLGWSIYLSVFYFTPACNTIQKKRIGYVLQSMITKRRLMNDAAEVLRGYFLFLSQLREALINRQSIARLRFPTIPTSRRSIVLHVNYLQKINLKRVGADLLLTIYRSEKSFVTRPYNVMKNGHRLVGVVACGICG